MSIAVHDLNRRLKTRASSVVDLVETSALVSRRLWDRIPRQAVYYYFFHHWGSEKTALIIGAYKFTLGRARNPQFKFLNVYAQTNTLTVTVPYITFKLNPRERRNSHGHTN